jgi:sigma-B regulation protein RsbU (phosphoserine phosphatase)
MDIQDKTRLEELVERLKLLHDISKKIMESKPLDILLDEIIEHSITVMQAEAASLLLYDTRKHKLVFHLVKGGEADYIKSLELDIGKGIAGWVAKEKKTVLIEDCYNDPRFNKDIDKKTGFRTLTMICGPLLKKDKLIGVMQVINKVGKKMFDESDQEIFETLASQCAVAIDNARLTAVQIKAARLENELETARKIQENLLPKVLPEYLDIAVKTQLIPATKIGGDYYNVIQIDDNNSLFMVVDVSGKSISAALIVSGIHTFIETYLIINRSGFVLKDFVSSLNKFLIGYTTSDKFASGWFGLFNHASRTLESVNCGHTPTYIFNEKDKYSQLLAGGIFLGIYDLEYSSELNELERGDAIIFYSDGITEAWNKDKEEFGEEKLLEVLKNNIDASAGDILNAVTDSVSKFVGRAEQSDDLTLGIVKIL